MMNRTVFILAATSAALLLAAGCGKKTESGPAVSRVDSTGTRTDSAAADSLSFVRAFDYSRFGEHAQDAREIRQMIEDVMARLRYGDKSGLYENEFPYFHENETFDDYLKHGEVSWANADSLDHIEIQDIIFYGRDSAWIDAMFHAITADGKIEPSYIRLQAYYQEGHWIKPYMSQYQAQVDYDKLIRQADEDSRKESW